MKDTLSDEERKAMKRIQDREHDKLVMLEDLGFCHAQLDELPMWLHDILDKLLDAGWKKK